MQQRISLITLGVADTGRARGFYGALGGAGESPDGDVVFFQAGGMILALWGRDELAEDSAVADGGGWGGVTLAHNVASSGRRSTGSLPKPQLREPRSGRAGAPTVWGSYSGIFIDPDGHAWEIRPHPGWVLGDDGSVRLH